MSAAERQPPGGILERIAQSTRARVARAKESLPPALLEERAFRARAHETEAALFPFERALTAPGLSYICELKRASPSKGVIAPEFPYLRLAKQFEEAGAAALSVLTEPEFFLGSGRYLREVAAAAGIPVLRKDFIVDPYQIDEAALWGAGAVLLIAALLDSRTLAAFIERARRLGLSALVETRGRQEIEAALEAGARIIGVNNRDLRTFEVDVSVSVRLRPLVPEGIVFVSESGIQTAADIRRLEEAGADAVLIGEALTRPSGGLTIRPAPKPR